MSEVTINDDSVHRHAAYDAAQELALENVAEIMNLEEHPYIKSAFQSHVMPQLREVADSDLLPADEYRQRLLEAFQVFVDLHESLHTYGGYDKNKPDRYKVWSHQPISMVRAGDNSRGFDIDRPSLLEVATRYVKQEKIQCNSLDWYFMDALVFAELDAFALHIMEGGGITINFAWMVANYSEVKYWFYSKLFAILALAIRYVAAPLTAIVLAANNHMVSATGVICLWGIYVLVRLWGVPFRWRAKKIYDKAWQHLFEVYTHLGQKVISPARFLAAIDSAAKDKVVFDGAIFAIADRINRTHPTAFIPFG